MGNISFKQYKMIDLSFITLLLLISESITTLATTTWFVAQPIAISTTLIFVLIGMMRWSGFGAIYAVVGGLTFAIVSGGGPQQAAIYAIGNLGALLALLVILPVGKEKVRASIPLLILTAAVAYLGMVLGRWLVSLAIYHDPGAIVAFLATDVISLLFAAVIFVLMRGVDGMIEDQKHYLLRLDRERRENPPETD